MDGDVVGGVVARANGLEEIKCQGVGVRAGEDVGFGRSESLDAGGGVDMDLDEVVGAVFLGELVRVAAVAVDVAERRGDATVGEEEHERVDAFWCADVEVPEHVCVGGVCDGMALVRAVQGWELDWIADEEDWLVVEDPVIVSFGGLELDGPAVEVSDGVC